MPHSQVIVVATRNAGKIREIRQILSDLPVELEPLPDAGTIPEPVEDGQTFADNARLKALYYASATGQWCLADDSGLAVDALNGAPGVQSARYAADDWPDGADRETRDAINVTRLLAELRDTDPGQRTARFVCHLALAGQGRILIETFDTVEGVIADRPRGINGFGYDPVFHVPHLGRTAAELSPAEKNDISHRGKAVRHFAALLESLLTHRDPGTGSG